MTSEEIELLGIILALLTSTISIIISVLALRQNSKMIRESTRPYITIYFDMMQLGSPMSYFVVKNFGQTGARILNCSYNDAIRNNKQSIAELPLFFDNLENMYLAPGQKYIVPCRIGEFEGDVAIFDLTYGDTIHQYSEHVRIHVGNYKKYMKPRFISKSEERNISYSLQEIAERML